MLRVAVALESAGIPAVAICAEAFAPLGRAIAVSSGAADLPIAEYPGPGLILTDTPQTFERKVRDAVVPTVVEALLGAHPTGAEPPKSAAASREPMDGDEPSPRSVVYSGSIEEVNDYFEQQGWSDGLPVLPPVQRSVDLFLSYTDRDPGEVIGVLPPENREATVWNCAVNGLMAGCEPRYMPVLLAIVEALCDPLFRIYEAGSTPGWEPLVTVSGPVVDEFEFNGGTGVMRVGRRPNATIGRFVRLYMRNVAGLRQSPFVTDQAGIGQSFNVVLAESQTSVQESGWPSVRLSLGYGPADSIVSVQSVRSITPPIYSSGSEPIDHLASILSVLKGTLQSSAHLAYKYGGRQYPLLVMSPAVTRIFADSGWSREQVQGYVADNALMPLDDLEQYLHVAGTTGVSIEQRARSMGLTLKSENGRVLAPMIVDQSSILIVAAGNPGRNQSKGYLDNGPQGSRIVRRIHMNAT